MQKYLVIIEFGKNTKFGNEDGLIDDICINYIQELLDFKSIVQERFGNTILALSTTSYLIKSDETEKELLETIKSIVRPFFDKEFYENKYQVYVASINSFEDATFREKKLELDYINSD